MEKGRIKEMEFCKMKEIFENIPDKKQRIVEKLIENAAFMAEQLDVLQNEINEKGCVSTYQNGENQWGTKKSPEVEIYNTMAKNYASVIKQLLELVEDTEQEGDELTRFLNGSGAK